jgi:hypothetical protein
VALARMLPTLDLRWEEKAARRNISDDLNVKSSEKKSAGGTGKSLLLSSSQCLSLLSVVYMSLSLAASSRTLVFFQSNAKKFQAFNVSWNVAFFHEPYSNFRIS